MGDICPSVIRKRGKWKCSEDCHVEAELGLKDISPIVENRVEKKTENGMGTIIPNNGESNGKETGTWNGKYILKNYCFL